MPKTGNSQEERQLIKLIEKMHLAEDDKKSWTERIRNGEMSQELAEEVRQKLAEQVSEGQDMDEKHATTRTRHLTELTMLVKRWQLSSQSRNFNRSR